jgi:hypothetical protein
MFNVMVMMLQLQNVPKKASKKQEDFAKHTLSNILSRELELLASSTVLVQALSYCAKITPLCTLFATYLLPYAN